jgi:hypothetical protein
MNFSAAQTKLTCRLNACGAERNPKITVFMLY